MADKIKNTRELKIEAVFSDGDTRIITLDNPRNDITAAQIKAIDATGIIIGDRAGSPFYGWDNARIVETQRTYLDIDGD